MAVRYTRLTYGLLQEIVELAKSGDYHTIYCSDQLRREKEKKKVFVGFGKTITH